MAAALGHDRLRVEANSRLLLLHQTLFRSRVSDLRSGLLLTLGWWQGTRDHNQGWDAISKQ